MQARELAIGAEHRSTALPRHTLPMLKDAPNDMQAREAAFGAEHRSTALPRRILAAALLDSRDAAEFALGRQHAQRAVAALEEAVQEAFAAVDAAAAPRGGWPMTQHSAPDNIGVLLL